MKTSSQRIYTIDNLELFGLLYEPDSKSQTILVHVHGMASNFYENFFIDFIAKTLTDSGIAFFVFNNRGCEYVKDLYTTKDNKRKMIRIGNTFERFEDCTFDIQAAIDFVKSKGYSSVHLSGHSLGGPKIAYYATENAKNSARAEKLASLIFISPADMVGLALSDKNYEQDLATAREMIAHGKGEELIPRIVWGDCYLSANTYINLSDKGSKVAIFNLYDPKDKLNVLGEIKIPAYTTIGRRDDALTVSVEEFADRIKNALKNSPCVETDILGDANHGYVGYEQELADKIVDWIKRLSKIIL